MALAFIAGGVIILAVDRGKGAEARLESTQTMTALDALKVGLAQCFALIPGTSRSGATIIGGMLFGLSRRAATEFSFFLAVPTLMAAGAYDMLKNRELLRSADAGMWVVGLATAGVSAFSGHPLADPLCGDARLPLVRLDRFAFGIVVLLTAYSGLVVWSK